MATPTDNPRHSSERTDHHRIAGLALAPMMTRLGYTTEVEVDVAFQKQLIDIIAVRRTQVVEQTLPPIYWQVFDDLNEHNLLSFKSYSESFNGFALEEFYGHLTNYCKIRSVHRRDVNLYVITNHYPRELLAPLLASGFVTEVRPREVYDLAISTLKRVRFIICSRTGNPILALFSTDIAHIESAYQTLTAESDLFTRVSTYWKQILHRLDKEIKNMYTKEDFLRDYPPTEDSPILLPWQIQELMQKSTNQGIGQGQRSERVAMIVQLLQRRFGTVPNEVSKALSQCTLDQLQALVNPALDTPDLDTFLTYIPVADAGQEEESTTEADNQNDAEAGEPTDNTAD